MLELKLTGTSYEMGRQHGEQLRDEIKQVLKCYLPLWGISTIQIHSRIEGYKKAILAHAPHLAEEIRGISDGADVSENLIYAINARTELLSGSPLHECTSFGVPSITSVEGHTFLGQNWDWLSSLRGLGRVIDINSQIKTFIEPGMVGKIGLNIYGVGVCLNFLDTEKVNKEGIPVHVLLRKILECKSANEALELIKNLPRAASANYLVGDISNNIFCAETTHDTVEVLKRTDFVTHTNVCNSRGEVCSRQKNFEQLIQEIIQKFGRISSEDLKSVLYDEKILCPKDYFGIETLSTVLIDLTDKRLSVSKKHKSSEFFSYN